MCPQEPNTITVNAEDYATVPNAASKQWDVSVTGVAARSFTYDENGNMLSDGLRTFYWDAEDRLVKILHASAFYTEFTYDGLDRRTSLVEKDSSGATILHRQFIWDSLEIAEERDGSNNVVRGYYAQGEQKGLQPLYHTRDHLGSIREVTDGNGGLVNRYDYDPYGKVSRKGVFHLGNAGEGPAIVSASSRLEHNSIGDRDLPLALVGAPTLETRGDVTLLVLTFDEDVHAVSGLEVQGAITPGEILLGNTVSIPLSDVENGRLITVKFAEISGPSGSNYDVTLNCGQLLADTNQDGYVNELDFEVVVALLSQPITSGNCHADLNRDGSINYLDFAAIRAQYHKSAFTDRLYTGHFWHVPSGLYLALYRAYDPELGRWISEDPIEEDGGINLYRYVGNNAIGRIDPSGLICIVPFWGDDPIGNAFKDIDDWLQENLRDPLGDWIDSWYYNPPIGPGALGGIRGSIYRVPGAWTPSGKPYIGRHNKPNPAKTRKSNDGRDRKKAEVIDEYDACDTNQGRTKEQKAIEDNGGVDNLDNKRNEIRKPK